MSERTLGPFRLEERLGTGGMGVVYRAVYTKDGRQVALKVLAPAVSANPKVAARFEREMAILERLRHPNIVRYLGGAKQQGRLYYAMELMEGGSIEGELGRTGTLSWERVVDIAAQVCEALAHAHAAGVVHRDLKPANLFTTADGTVKLGDFGIARDMEATALTEAGKTVGTYAYMAPEQITGKPPVSHKTDLYALGCVMFQMLSGRPPFEAATAAEMLYKHVEDQPPRVRPLAPECPVWLERLVDRLLAKDPAQRPYDALATRAALDEVREKVARGESVSAATVAGGPTQLNVDEREQRNVRKLVRGDRRRRRRDAGPVWERTWFLAAALAAVVAGIVWVTWPPSEEELYAETRALWEPVEAQMLEDEEQLYGVIDARRAFDRFLERHPEGRRADEVRTWLADVESHRLEREAITTAARDGTPTSEAQRQFIDAYRYEQFGDRVTALAKYRAMIAVLENRTGDRPYVQIARRRIRRIEARGGGAEDRVAIVEAELERADGLHAEGKVIAAERIWNGIVTLYADGVELGPQVGRARARLAGDHRHGAVDEDAAATGGVERDQ